MVSRNFREQTSKFSEPYGNAENKRVFSIRTFQARYVVKVLLEADMVYLASVHSRGNSGRIEHYRPSVWSWYNLIGTLRLTTCI